MTHFVADFDHVAFSFGFIELRWYALAYIFGFLAGTFWIRFIIAKLKPANVSGENIMDFLNWAILGVIIGGRLGYVLFYNPSYYLANPIDIVKVWEGGMSFHGGFMGMLGALYFFSKKHGIAMFAIGDLLACGAPLALFLGRISNFINGELWGHPTEVAWAVIFPAADNLPRHPSQLYEAALEGMVIFIILNILAWRGGLKRSGFLSGLFFILYGSFRIFVEEFRVSDPVPEALQNILIIGGWGQWLSVPMVLIGLALVVFSGRKKQ